MSGANVTPNAEAIRSLRLQLFNAKRQFEDGLNAVSMALKTLDAWEGVSSENSTQTNPAEREIALRRARGGRKPLKIETDLELEGFIRERINHLTFPQDRRRSRRSFPARTTDFKKWYQSMVGKGWSQTKRLKCKRFHEIWVNPI